MQAAAPSAFMHILTTAFDQLELPCHFSLLSHRAEQISIQHMDILKGEYAV